MIMEMFDKMKKDEVLVLTNDHNPEGLYFQLMVMRENEFDKDNYEVEEDKWVAKIRKK